MIFQPVMLSWKGDDFEVPADRVMMLIAQVEDIVTLPELLSPKGRPLAKISMAYGAALRYAGAKVRDDEIYASMFSEGSSESAASAVNGLLSMMLPPSAVETKPAKKAKRQSGASSS